MPSEYLSGGHVTPRYNEQNPELKFFDKRMENQKVPPNDSVKTSHMRNHISQREYNMMRTKVNSLDFGQRMKIVKPQKYLRP